MSKKIHIESLAMGAVLALIVLGGGLYAWMEEQKVPTREVNNNLKRYDEGNLHHVAEDLIHYQRETSFKTKLDEVWGIAIGEAGVYVCGKGGFDLYTNQGEKVFSVKADETVRYIGLNEKSELMACVGNSIAIYDQKGMPLRRLENSSWGLLNGVLQKGEYYYIADRSSRLIWKCDLEGKIIKQMGSHLDGGTHNFVIPGPYMDISFNPKGEIVASNPGRHQVNTFDVSGKMTQSFGQPSFKHTGFCGCCNPVALTVLKNGNVVTTEKGIARVKILSEEGDLLGIVAPPKDFRANKHAFVVDLIEGPEGKIYMLDNETKEVLIYKKKEPNHV